MNKSSDIIFKNWLDHARFLRLSSCRNTAVIQSCYSFSLLPPCKDIWTPKVGDENFCFKSESENQHDKFAVAILLEENVVGHVPINLSKIFHQFLKISNCTIGCKVTGKRVSLGAGYGLEIPVQYIFVGAEKAAEWAEKHLKKVFENVNKKGIKCLK